MSDWQRVLQGKIFWARAPKMCHHKWSTKREPEHPQANTKDFEQVNQLWTKYKIYLKTHVNQGQKKIATNGHFNGLTSCFLSFSLPLTPFSHLFAQELMAKVEVSAAQLSEVKGYVGCEGWPDVVKKWWRWYPEKIGMTPLPPHKSMRNNMCVCVVYPVGGGGFLLPTRLNPWKRKTTLTFFLGGGGRVVQGMKWSWIIMHRANETWKQRKRNSLNKPWAVSSMLYFADVTVLDFVFG